MLKLGVLDAACFCRSGETTHRIRIETLKLP
jgi:hypothetical protein